MPFVLDSADISGSCSCSKIPPRLPEAVRKHGHIPEFTDMRIGDLILVAPKRPSFSQNLIQTVQSNCHSEDDRGWTHAAIYIGNFLICEAITDDGVSIASIFKYVPGYRLKFREPTNFNGDERYHLVIRALTRLRQGYDSNDIFNIVFAYFRGSWRPGFRIFGRAADKSVCSQLYADAYAEATGHVLVETPDGIVLPGDLSACDRMRDREVRWADLSRRGVPEALGAPPQLLHRHGEAATASVPGKL
jgi:hypothetical protein